MLLGQNLELFFGIFFVQMSWLYRHLLLHDQQAVRLPFFASDTYFSVLIRGYALQHIFPEVPVLPHFTGLTLGVRKKENT